jgi:hypothetical protein
MSLKDNVDYIKQEISNEEKFFESFFKIEKLWKKNKLFIIVIIIAVIGYFAFNSISTYLKNENDIKANKAYNILLENPQDANNLQILQEKNKILLDVIKYKTNSDKNVEVNVQYLKEISKFNHAIKTNDIQLLDELIVNSEFLLRDYALFNKALIQTNNKAYDKAKKTLELIPQTSNVKAISSLLQHYLLTK